MTSIASHSAPLSSAIPQSIYVEDVNMKAEPSRHPSQPPSSAAENCFRNG
jgi:hypothetical protein